MPDDRWRINMSLTPREYVLIERAAQEDGYKVTTWAKSQLLRIARKDKKKDD